MNQWKFTEEAKAQVSQWNQETIALIEDTSDFDLQDVISPIKKLYEHTDLDSDINIVKVDSVFIGAAVNAAAAFYWAYLKNSATDSVTDSATRSATDSATRLATHSVTDSVTDLATHSATDSATRSVIRSVTDLATDSTTRLATDSAIRSATDLATDSATRSSATDPATHSAISLATYLDTYSVTDSATDSATRLAIRSATRSVTSSKSSDVFLTAIYVASQVVADRLGLPIEKVLPNVSKIAKKNWLTFYNGGSEWASWPRYLEFVRVHCGFEHKSHSKFKDYLRLCDFGPRFMHEKYVIFCGKAKSRHKNESNVLHNESGPAIEWRCGTKLWYINGVQVTQQIVEFPESLKIEQINKEKDNDVQRIMLERYGVVKYIEDTNAKCLDFRHCDISNTMEQLYEILGQKKLLAVDPSGAGIVVLTVPNSINTCEEAQQWLDPNPTGGTFLFRT